LAKWLLESIVNHPEIKDVRAIMLATKDAHNLYKKFGFKLLEEPEKYMKRKN
jgi:N-acetylglutamate synthase-like GNAT family acetyltransferase